MADVLHETTGDRVRRALREAGVTQAKAASAIGVSQGQLSRRLAGRVRFKVDDLMTIARLCRVSASSLLPAEREVVAA